MLSVVTVVYDNEPARMISEKYKYVVEQELGNDTSTGEQQAMSLEC